MLRTLLRRSLEGDVRCVQTFLHRRQLATRMPGMHFGLTATEDRYGGVTANLGELSEAISDAGFGAILAGNTLCLFQGGTPNCRNKYRPVVYDIVLCWNPHLELWIRGSIWG